MNTITSTHRTLSLALAFTGVFLVTNMAVAQPVTEEVIVRAPIERVKVKSVPGSGTKVEIIELNRYVSFDDLDLSRHADVITLDARIAAVAKESCQNLSDMFPLDRSDPLELNRCVKKAIASAGERREILIAAAP